MGTQLQRISSTDLQAFDRLDQALDRALDLAGVVNVHGTAEIYRVACVKAKRGIAVQNRAAEIRLRAERKAGAMLATLPRSNGGKPPKKTNSVHRGPSFKDAIKGIVTESTAKRWQREAGIDEKVFRDVIKAVQASVNTDKPTELTAAALRRAWAKVKPVKSNVITVFPDGTESTDTRWLKHEVDAWEIAMLDADCRRKMHELRAYLNVRGMADAVVALINRAHKEWLGALQR